MNDQMNSVVIDWEDREDREEISKSGPSESSHSKSTGGKSGKKEASRDSLGSVAPLQSLPSKLEDQRPKRPSYRVYDDYFLLHGVTRSPGLYWHDQRKDQPVDQLISTPIHVTALTKDDDGSNWGEVLRFMDPDGKWREWSAPMRLLRGGGEMLLESLLDQGFRLQLKNKAHFISWLMQQVPRERLVAATQVGWHQNSSVFVLPGESLGDDGIRFQSESAMPGAFEKRGSLKAWRKSVSEKCRGNPLAILSVSVALAGPLLLKAKQLSQGGAGVHLIGRSSRGKSTLLGLAASVWGSPHFVGTWRATANGLEGAATGQNDTCLILDELGECDPKTVGQTVYLLGNGSGKQRSNRNGGARKTHRWRLMVVSSGEKTLTDCLKEVGQQIYSGQEARLIDLPATDRKYGAFDELHDASDGRVFSDSLKQAVMNDYGHAGPEFVNCLLSDERDLPEIYADIKNLPVFETSDPVEGRVAGWFALIAMAGELASEFGITGWNEGEALDAAAECFKLWTEQRGQLSIEERHVLDGIRRFVERYGESRFSYLKDSEDLIKASERAGWYEDTENGRRYLFTADGLYQAVPGYSLKQIVETLAAAGWLGPSDPGRKAKTTYIASRNGTNKLYVVMIGDSDGH